MRDGLSQALLADYLAMQNILTRHNLLPAASSTLPMQPLLPIATPKHERQTPGVKREAEDTLVNPRPASKRKIEKAPVIDLMSSDDDEEIRPRRKLQEDPARHPAQTASGQSLFVGSNSESDSDDQPPRRSVRAAASRRPPPAQIDSDSEDDNEDVPRTARVTHKASLPEECKFDDNMPGYRYYFSDCPNPRCPKPGHKGEFRIQLSWVISIVFGMTKPVFDSLLTHALEISHLCGHSNCLVYDHWVVENHTRNLSRKACERYGACVGSCDPPCMPPTNAETIKTKCLRIAPDDRNTKDGFFEGICRVPGCERVFIGPITI